MDDIHGLYDIFRRFYGKELKNRSDVKIQI